ncbi:MAG: ribosome biogenesis GTPase Der [Deltaproteobacteria bacterium]|nr:ribosome biogenesis GTPase Der [Deltaproteobacteria bacterium]
MTTIIAIVGRPNVGKSTLFNRLKKSRDSLVDDLPGVTRDRVYASIHWDKHSIVIIDTGGFEDPGKDPLLKQVREQAEQAIADADRVIFMLDGKQGLMPGDEEIAQVLRKSGKKFFTVINKIDGPEHQHVSNEFFELGVEKVFAISSAHGFGLKPFMEEIVKDLPEPEPEKEELEHRIKVAILGRPNVGKSSLINRVLGFDRLLVSKSPGTTRDSIDILFNWKGREYLLIDTAGIRRKGKVKDRIDKYSMIKSMRSLERCHIAVILLDAEEGIAEQDARVCGYALERGRGIVLAVNKWDIVKADQDKKRHINRSFERQFNFIPFAPRINLSALTGERTKQLFDKINLVNEHFSKRISTGKVNRTIEEILLKKPPPMIGKVRLKLYYATQVGIRPPTFVVFVNRPEMVHFSYKRFIINQLREKFGINHAPLRLFFKGKK